MLIPRKLGISLRVGVWVVMAVLPLIAQDPVSLVGSGSNLASPLYSVWTTQFGKQHPNVQVTYLSLGTAQSIKEIREGAGDFNGGEIPLSNAQKHGGKYGQIYTHAISYGASADRTNPQTSGCARTTIFR